MAARYGLGVTHGVLKSAQIAEKLNGNHVDEMRKPHGIIDEAMLITPRRMDVIAAVQKSKLRGACAGASAP